MLANFLPKPISPYPFIVLAIFVTLPLAYLSWQLIEKHALELAVLGVRDNGTVISMAI